MMTLFCKRFTEQDVATINEELYRRTHLPKDTPSNGGGNNRALVLDATAALVNVRYPPDLALLNECEGNAEKLIDGVGESAPKADIKSLAIAKARASNT